MDKIEKHFNEQSHKSKLCSRCKKKLSLKESHNNIYICGKCSGFVEDTPSKNANGYWSFAFNTKKASNIVSQYNGKWMIFVNIKYLDNIWKKVKIATEKGLLGNQSKCSTAKENPNAFNKDTKVIIIYTNDCRDMNDVSRVAWQIYLLGIVGKVISYKTDKATYEKKYLVRGDKKISLYSLSINEFKDKTEKEFYKYFKEKYK